MMLHKIRISVVCWNGQVLEFLPELFDMLRDEAYALTESEAAIFLPCLVEKVLYRPWLHNF